MAAKIKAAIRTARQKQDSPDVDRQSSLKNQKLRGRSLGKGVKE